MKVSFTRLGKPKPVLPNLEKIIAQELAKEQKAILREYQSTTRTWANKPEFEVDEESEGAVIGTDNPIYGYVDHGTKPHVIRPKRAKKLHFFASGFVSKTVPRRLNPRAGRKATKAETFSSGVQHPGTEGREFSKIIRERSTARFWRNLQKRIKQELNV